MRTARWVAGGSPDEIDDDHRRGFRGVPEPAALRGRGRVDRIAMVARDDIGQRRPREQDRR